MKSFFRVLGTKYVNHRVNERNFMHTLSLNSQVLKYTIFKTAMYIKLNRPIVNIC